MITPDFLFGVIVGFSLAVFVNFIYSTHKGFVSKIQEADKKQRTSQETGKTPSEIVREADRAQFRLFLFWITVIFGLLVLFEITSGTVTRILLAFGFL
jgi:hypothetical protein